MVRRALKNRSGMELILIRIASSFSERFFGLMGKKGITVQDSLLFPHCSSIHTFFMRENIDVVFLSKEGTVIKVVDSLKPWKLLLPLRGATHCIELPAQEFRKWGVQEGDRLICEGVFE